MLPETRRVMTLLRRRGRTQNRELRFPVPGQVLEYFRQFFSPRSRYYVFTFRDPVPFFADIGFMMRKAVCLLLDSRRRSHRIAISKS